MSKIQLFMAEMDAKGRAKAVSAFGIDLGTTNSTVAKASWVPGEKPVCRVLEIDQPLWLEGTMTSPLVPSVVAILDGDGSMVGEGAKRLHTSGRYRCVLRARNFAEARDMADNRFLFGEAV